MDGKIGTVEIRGEKYDLLANDTGYFVVELEGSKWRALTLAELKRKVSAELRRRDVKVAIPFDMVIGHGELMNFRRGVLTGIHAGTGNVMVRWSDTGKAEQLEGYGHRVFRPTTTAEQEAYKRLLDAKLAAEKELDEFTKTIKIDARQAIREAVDVAMGKEQPAQVGP